MCGNTDPYYVLMGRVIQKFRKAARMKQHELAADLKTTGRSVGPRAKGSAVSTRRWELRDRAPRTLDPADR